MAFNLEKVKKHPTEENVKELQEYFFSLVEQAEALTGLKKVPLLPVLGKTLHYKVLFDIAATGDEQSVTFLLDGLQSDLNFIELQLGKATEIGKNLDKISQGKNSKITKKNEIIVFTRSEQFGFYIIYIHQEHLRVFNITNTVNGYHIFETGNFCSGNTYQTLRDVIIKDNDIPLFLAFLKKVLTDYDDNAYHCAQPKHFKPWKQIQKELKSGELSLKNRRALIKILHEKFKVIRKYIFPIASKEAQKYIEDKIDEFEHFIRSMKVK